MENEHVTANTITDEALITQIAEFLRERDEQTSQQERDEGEREASAWAIVEMARRAALAAAPKAEPVKWPKERVNIPDPYHSDARIVGFRIREGDEAFGDHGLSEPLFWLTRMCAAPTAPSDEKRMREALEKIAETKPSGHLDFHGPKYSAYEAFEIAKTALKGDA